MGARGNAAVPAGVGTPLTKRGRARTRAMVEEAIRENILREVFEGGLEKCLMLLCWSLLPVAVVLTCRGSYIPEL